MLRRTQRMPASQPVYLGLGALRRCLAAINHGLAAIDRGDQKKRFTIS
jgi:hypothetical protein